jgi:hypothetical protein
MPSKKSCSTKKKKFIPYLPTLDFNVRIPFWTDTNLFKISLMRSLFLASSAILALNIATMSRTALGGSGKLNNAITSSSRSRSGLPSSSEREGLPAALRFVSDGEAFERFGEDLREVRFGEEEEGARGMGEEEEEEDPFLALAMTSAADGGGG